MKGKRKKWLLHRTGVNHVHLKFDVERSGVKVVLELLHRSEEERLENNLLEIRDLIKI